MKVVRAVAVMVIAVMLVAGCGRSGGGGPVAQSAPAAKPSQPVSAQLQFSAKTLDGAPFSGQSLLGKPAVLWFWAPWCPICQHEAPGVGQVAQANPAVSFVGVAAQDQVPAMRDFVSRYQLGFFPQLADVDASVWRQFGVTAQPAYAFIHPDGSVEVVKTGLSQSDLSHRVAALAAS